MSNRIGIILVSLLLATSALALPNSELRVLRGWLSDDSCAKARASGGTFSATNQDCAKECVAKGKKIVLIDPEHKKVVAIANQETVKNNLGDYVELAGTTDAHDTLHVDSLKFLDKNRAMCGVPEKKAGSKAE
jgi:hypothetical protein